MGNEHTPMTMEITNSATVLFGRTTQIRENHAKAVSGTNILHAIANWYVNTLSKSGAVTIAARRPTSNIAAPVKPLTTSEYP
jgi:hypothetical protein